MEHSVQNDMGKCLMELERAYGVVRVLSKRCS
jgi:hypothetical protein